MFTSLVLINNIYHRQLILRTIYDMTMTLTMNQVYLDTEGKNEHKGIIKKQNGRNDNKNINISKHDTKLISVVRLVIVLKYAPEISLVQVF